MLRAWILARAAAVIVLVGLGAEPAPAQGSPPQKTDDPGVAEVGVVEVTIGADYEQTRDERIIEGPLLLIDYGLVEDVEITVGVPMVTLIEDGEKARTGLGDIELAMKWRFLQQENHGISAALNPELFLANPTSSDERGLVPTGTQFRMTGQVGRRFGKLYLGAELIHVFDDSNPDEWGYGVAAGYSLTERIELLGEIHGTAQAGFDHDELLFTVGTEYDISPDATLLFSIGRSLRGSSTGEPELVSFAGVEFRF